MRQWHSGRSIVYPGRAHLSLSISTRNFVPFSLPFRGYAKTPTIAISVQDFTHVTALLCRSVRQIQLTMEDIDRGSLSERNPPHDRRSTPRRVCIEGRTILNPSAAAFVPRIPHRPIYMFEDLSVEGRQLSAVGIGRHAQRSDQRNPMAVEPLPQVTPRGPALKHEPDLEHAHTLDRREVR